MPPGAARQERVRLECRSGLRSMVACFAVGLLASSTAFVAVSFVPAAAVHTMVPAVGTSANFEVLDDAQYDAAPGLSCQNPTAPMPCYTPQQIRTAYNMESVINGGTTGAGQTILIIAGFQDPTLLTGLARFDQTFGLPATTPLVTAPHGPTEFDPSSAIQKGWALEIATAVES